MIESEKYYLTCLYPVQDKVLHLINGVQGEFYLTGGTALSRGYLNHRFSDDLDFFTNESDCFSDLCKDVIGHIKSIFSTEVTISSQPDSFQRIHIVQNDIRLKIDFVNDLPCYFGEVAEDPILGRIDNPYNILTNKLGAIVSRGEAKDAIDIWGLLKSYDFCISDLARDASEKSADIDLGYIAELLITLPKKFFDERINWISKPDWDGFQQDMRKIARKLLLG